MANDVPSLPPSTDPLGETLHLLRMGGTLYCRADFTEPWGLDLPPLEDTMMLHVVTAGQCWLETPDEKPRLLRQGSVALVPHGAGHVLRSAPDAKADPLFDLPVEKVSERYEILRHGGGGEAAQTICVVVRFDHVAAERLVSLLPSVLQIDTWEDDDTGWLRSTLQFISREARSLKPGGETVITRLADILVIQMIRSWMASAPEAQLGWLAALRDEQIGQALATIHRAPEKDWSVESLARQVGMSRSAFSARFSELVGEPVMRYLTWWRLQRARTHLLDSPDPLSVIAGRVGYDSEPAFCRAFKRMFGVSPGSMRRGRDSTVITPA